MSKKYISVIIPAAGLGKRMQQTMAKQYLKLNGKAILEHTLTKFQEHEEVNEIVLVLPESDIENHSYLKSDFPKISKIISGGKERQNSVSNGLRHVHKESDYILVHDAARPLIRKEEISKIIKSIDEHDVVVLAVPVKETIKVADKLNKVTETPNRDNLWSVQTPQGMKFKLMKKLYEKLESTNFMGTDEAMVAEYFGSAVYIVEGHYQNIKITSPEDLLLAELLMKGKNAI